MKNRELIKQLYHFIIKLSLKVPRKDFETFRVEWETLNKEIETKIKING